ncbi:hypothetical protein L0636_01080 [Halomonas janggokensis]|uniref:Uncharacterized protein n=1 Tax=Vreelandella janggokensis TaxID=370767 RepID=A0ABT4IS46_9GAMM|nr:hypothetical protein [Halomonas janggokensis]MCZ0926481.1 hypothetical protein [Halomonas janggokensis]MCZ0929019.1 hypothetical protein [Halomonas janggokensis]
MPKELIKDATPTLRDIIRDCGGPGAVAKRLGCSVQNVNKMILRGHLPYSELKERSRAEILAGMQEKGDLTADQIRRIGLGI